MSCLLKVALQIGLIWGEVALAGGAPIATQPTTTAPGTTGPTHRRVAVSETEQVPESSGVVASRLNPDVYWTHNDSGAYRPRLWAFRLSAEDRSKGIAKDMGYVELKSASIVDWEDIAAGPDGTLYVFDGGDNRRCDRTDKRVYRFKEPKIDPAQPPIQTTTVCENMRFEYPDLQHPDRPASSNDARYDAECLLVHPASRDVYIVTKRDRKQVPVTRVYKLAAAAIKWDGHSINVLTFVCDLGWKVPLLATGGDIHPTGTRVVIRDYLRAYEFRLPAGEPFERIFDREPTTINLLGEPKGEGICYSVNGDELISTSEVQSFGLRKFPVFVTRLPP